MSTPIDSSALPQGAPQPTVEGYEKSDLASKWVFGFFGLLFVSAILIHLFIAWQMRELGRKPSATDQWTTARRSGGSAATTPRPFPRLQLSAPADLQAFRAHEEAELNSYGWVDKTAGVVRIPIGSAMDW